MIGGRPLLARVRHISAALSSRKRISAGELASELEICRRTIARDIDFMRDRLLLPIEADAHGYYFREDVRLCPCCSRRMRSS